MQELDSDFPRLPKKVQFSEKFDTDWRMNATKNLFLGMGNENFAHFFKSWVGEMQQNQLCLEELCFKKFIALMPKRTNSADTYIQENIEFLMSLSDSLSISPSFFNGQACTHLMAINQLSADNFIKKAVSSDDVQVFLDTFKDLTQLFYMLQYIDLFVLSPERAPKLTRVWEKGQWVSRLIDP